MIVLGGDIGGTSTRLRLVDADGLSRSVVDERTFASDPKTQFNIIVQGFLDSHKTVQIDGACFAVAGPVTHSGEKRWEAQVTSLPWRLDSRQLEQTLRIPSVRLLNDFEAIGYSLAQLAPGDLHWLQGSGPRPGNCVVVGAGTGLGVCQVIEVPGAAPLVVPTEGGHIEFGPQTAEQIGLLNFLRSKYQHVSYDRVVSGPGLVDMFRFVVEARGLRGDDAVQRVLSTTDVAATITEEASHLAAARQALQLFMEIYGAAVGNYALVNLAKTIYVAGGIAPKNLAALEDSSFLRTLKAKGRISHVLNDTPIAIIRNTTAGLLGAVEGAVSNVQIGH